MIAIDQIESTVEQLAAIRQAIIAMRPSRHEPDRLNRVYGAILKVEIEPNRFACIRENKTT